MPYLALVDDVELELADVDAVQAALTAGRITAETWIADTDQEADWQIVAERFPHLVDPQP